MRTYGYTDSFVLRFPGEVYVWILRDTEFTNQVGGHQKTDYCNNLCESSR